MERGRQRTRITGPPQNATQTDAESSADDSPSLSPTGLDVRFTLDHEPPRGRSISPAQAYLARPSLDSRRSPSVMSIMQIDQIISDDRMNMETYGVAEMRDGFFDALFLKPDPIDPDEVVERSKAALPKEFEKSHPLSAKHFFPRQLHEFKSVTRKVATTRAGIQLLKSFLAFFIAYILCLIQPIHEWLGYNDYIMVVSTIINHPGRNLGSQVDGTVGTIIGTAAGLAWGYVAILISESTNDALKAYGWIIIVISAVFFAGIALIRSIFIRLYQTVLCAGIALAFTTLGLTDGDAFTWHKPLQYGIPWLLGQAIALAVNCLVFPDAGNRLLAVAFHRSFNTMQESLVIPRPRDTGLRRRLAKTFMDMSLAYRDMRIDITITRFRPNDVRELRNSVQGVVRALLAMNTDTDLFEDWSDTLEITVADDAGSESEVEDSGRKVARALSAPTREVIDCWRKHFGPSEDVSSDLVPVQLRMQNSLAAFDTAEDHLLRSNDRPETYADHGQAVEFLVFARHVRETAGTVVNLMTIVQDMYTRSKSIRVNLPVYPFGKALYRTNAQVRHDRGGVTAGMYRATFAEIAKLIETTRSSEKHHPRDNYEAVTEPEDCTVIESIIHGSPAVHKDRLSYKLWKLLRRCQGFETKYATKVVLLLSALSLPCCFESAYFWRTLYDAWWAVAVGWIMIHPRIGGNIQDFFTRAFAAVLGAAWSGAAHAASGGNPYVLAVFAAIYMIPMIYRFTQSTHPRSGLVGCLSFAVISLTLRDASLGPSVALQGVYKGLVFLVGTIAPIIVNWMLWPFIARHELRIALSSMILYMSIMYRNVVANYVYFDEGKDPTPETIRRSEMLESRMREGFVRIRQLLVMSRHEIRLRGPFDPIPYSCLAASCERFFEYLIAVRQSALFYNPNYIRDNPVAAGHLHSYRRDAVAAILGNLYILAVALRSERKVPRYLPSAAAARKKLLHRTAELAREMEEDTEGLTGCVAQLEELERFTKLIVGEKKFERPAKPIEEDDEDTDVSPERL
ncbi:BRE4-like protein [Fusarium globosum]|uniref:BRE4-like protein n=1 Tax=Fusarium globosum TaxID=78864 RepID=A0A8H6D572_9HYPO|nr:BRE4-like protein [Fusarium globosum]